MLNEFTAKLRCRARADAAAKRGGRREDDVRVKGGRTAEWVEVGGVEYAVTLDGLPWSKRLGREEEPAVHPTIWRLCVDAPRAPTRERATAAHASRLAGQESDTPATTGAGFAAGGTSDNTCRRVGTGLTGSYAKTVVVANRPGAGRDARERRDLPAPAACCSVKPRTAKVQQITKYSPVQASRQRRHTCLLNYYSSVARVYLGVC